MSSPPEEEARTLTDFADVLAALSNEGFECVVIGGCAVGAYAHLLGEKSFSAEDPALLAELRAIARARQFPEDEPGEPPA